MKILGDAAEARAVRHLETLGYRILARNVKSKVGELDIVAREGRVVCFVEVRSRKDGSAAESVTISKQKKLVRAAAHYLASHRLDTPCRFDVVTVGPNGMTLVRNAFEADS